MLEKLHERYGPVVRYAPNDLFVTHPRFIIPVLTSSQSSPSEQSKYADGTPHYRLVLKVSWPILACMKIYVVL